MVPSYARYDITLSHGKGTYVWDTAGKRYLDAAGGIAVNSLGHAHPRLTDAIHEQSQKLMHISNLYYSEPQGQLAAKLTELFGGRGKVFFSNSGAEANEGMLKLARKFGSSSDVEPGRYEIITTLNSFHGRTLATIAATGQDKIKKGFHPMMDGFTHVAYNDLEAMEAAIGPKTCAIMLEGIQGEGGIVAAFPEYLLGVRALCDKHNLLLLMDGVQCGHFRTGCFQSYQRILEETPNEFQPDAVSMAKSLGGGFPIGAFWVSSTHEDILGEGYHGTTYGGNPLACAAALQVLEVVEDEKLDENAREIGSFLTACLTETADLFPDVLKSVRGYGLMMGFEISPEAYRDRDGTLSSNFVKDLHKHGVLSVPSGDKIVRLLPPLNITKDEATELHRTIEGVCAEVSDSSGDPGVDMATLKDQIGY